MNLEDAPRYAAFVLVLSMLCILAELLWRRYTRRGNDLRELGATLAVAFGNRLATRLSTLAVITPVYAWVYQLSPLQMPVNDWRVWAAGFVAVEFAYYWFHRLSHEVRWLWAHHSTHHTPEQLTLLSAVRIGWTNVIAGGWLVYLPLMALGFPPQVVLVWLSIDLAYQFFLHTEAVGKLGPLEWVLNTPSHHRVHHGRNPRYLDRNYGGMVIVFDRVFGTFAEEDSSEPVQYGLVHPLGSLNPLRLVFGEWQRMLQEMWASGSWRSAVRIALSRPGERV